MTEQIEYIYKRLLSNTSWDSELNRCIEQANFLSCETSWSCLVKIANQINFDELFPSLLPNLIEFISSSFDPDRAVNNLERFSEKIYDKNYLYTILNNNKWLVKTLITLFSGSQILTDVLFKEPQLFSFLSNNETIEQSETKDNMFRTIAERVEGKTGFESLLPVLRGFKKQEFLRIGLRDLLKTADLTETMADISHVADVCLQMAYRFCESILIGKFGVPSYKDEDGDSCRSKFTIIGMGKLGGMELNFSSDIDIIYLYSSEKGKTKGSRNSISNHEFYTKLATMITRAINEITEDGNVFRVDLGLRPEGSSGDIVSSLRSHEVYYESWGQTWERMALIKARTVAGSEELGIRFRKLTETFIYRKYLDTSAIDEMKSIKDKVNRRLKNNKSEQHDVKLGGGGIREIEFTIQIFQLLYGGKDKTIRERNSIKALRLSYEKGYIVKEDYETLTSAYTFLRNLEHRIQISFGLQTHKIPSEVKERAVLAKKMNISGEGLDELSDMLMQEYGFHTSKVQVIYNSILGDKILPDKENLKNKEVEKEILFSKSGELLISEELLANFNFSDYNKVKKSLKYLYEGHSFSHPSLKSKEKFYKLFPNIIKYSCLSPDPDQSINNLEKFISASGSKESFFSLFVDNEKVLKLILLVFGNSDFLSMILIRHTDLIVILCDREGINRYKTKERMKEGLDELIKIIKDRKEIKSKIEIFKKGEQLRIGAKFLLGKTDLEGTCEDLSNLAEVCLDATLDAAENILKKKFGIPFGFSSTPFYKKNVLSENKKGTLGIESASRLESSLVVIGMGKLGGHELDFGSDLDLVFIYSEDGSTSGIGSAPESMIDNHYYFSKVCESIFKMMDNVYKIDSALRPEGDKGVLAISINNFEKYLKTRARTWERQSLIKARPVAGNLKTGDLFIKRIHNILFNATPPASILIDIRNMRERMEKELGKEKKGRRNIKFGYGGLIDIEFIVQFFQMKYGVDHVSLRTPETAVALDELKRKGVLSPDDHAQLKKSYTFYKKILLSLRIEYQTAKSVMPELLEKLSKRMAYVSSEAVSAEDSFMTDYKNHSDSVRNIYKKVFNK